MAINMDEPQPETKNNINRIHEKAVRIIYRDKKSTFKELLEKDNSVTTHVKNLHVLVTEMYNVQNNCSPEIMTKVFPTNEAICEYDLRNTSDFAARRIKTVRYGSESLSYLGPRLWNILPDEYKKVTICKTSKLRSDCDCLKTANVGCVNCIFNI